MFWPRHMCLRVADIRGEAWLLASQNCSERAEFEDVSAVSLATSGSKSLHFTFYSGKFTRHSNAITRHSNASETTLKRCIEITE